MWVKMSEPYRYLGRLLNPGETIDIAGFVGTQLIAFNMAEKATEPTDLRERFLERLNVGAGRPCVFLPFVGEFGHKIMYHMRLVEWHEASEKIVCCRRGEEVLYPSADAYFYDWTDPIDDAERAGTDRIDRQWPKIEERYCDHVLIPGGGLTYREEMFCIRPEKRIDLQPFAVRGLHVDVCIGTRARQFMPRKNWPYAQLIGDWLRNQELTFAVIGTRASSYAVDGMKYPMSGDYGDIDAAVELLQNCRCFVGIDSGAAHLASTVGCPMVVQAVPDSRSFIMGRMAVVNPGKVTEVPETAWDHPEALIAALAHQLEPYRAQPEEADAVLCSTR